MENKTDLVEKRIKPGIIRRRAKDTPKEAEEPAAAPAPKETVAANSAGVRKKAKPAEEAVPTAPEPTVEAETVAAPISEAPPAVAEAPLTAKAPVKPEDASKIKGPRSLPEGPPVGTIIQLPHMKKKPEDGEPGVAKPAGLPGEAPEKEDDEEKKAKAKKAGKKSKFDQEELELEGIGRVSTLSQIARISTRSQADRVFQPSRTGKRRRGKSKREGRKTATTVPKAIKRVIKMEETITVSELAQQLGIKGNEVVKKLMDMGSMVTLNQPIDFETASVIAHEYQWEVKRTGFQEETFLKAENDQPENLVHRAPVVTVMGHVDHGKTSLLDAIRSTQVAAGEHGGITQHIGAYRVKLGAGKELTFLDTPGHEAFTAMRARGAAVTDIVILVVAADDGVMPQTIEAIHHAKAAGVPIIVAVNKIDKPEAKPETVMRQLSEHGLLSEAWGGDTLFVNVSAKARNGIEEMLESIFLQAEILDLKANPNKRAKGVIVEARLERGRGPVATALVQEGTLHLGDIVVAGSHYGRVRGMVNDRGEPVEAAGPGYPVEIQGLDGVPQASEAIQALEDDKAAKQIVEHRQIKERGVRMAASIKMSLEDLFSKVQTGEAKELPLIVKGDVQGSVEAFQDSLKKLSTDKVRVDILHAGVGAITESDVMLASASNGVIIGFQVRPDPKARELSEQEGVEVKVYNVIYDAVDDVKNAMEGLLEPTQREKYLGRAEIRQVFNISKVGTVAGTYVNDGKIQRSAQVRLLRDNVILYTGKLSSLKRFKDDARDVEQGYECGMGIEGYNDIKPGDVIECFLIETVKTKLS